MHLNGGCEVSGQDYNKVINICERVGVLSGDISIKDSRLNYPCSKLE